MKKYVYDFNEGNKDMRNVLGGKGANLAEMTNIGLPVPSGFTISTEACLEYLKDKIEIPDNIISEIFNHIKILEEKTGKIFGNKDNPLLVSVRSGAPISMPGMMDSILNIGLNDEIAESFSKKTQNPHFVYDSYRRLIQMFSDVVKGIPKSNFECLFEQIKITRGKEENEFTEEELKGIIKLYKEEYFESTKEQFPENPYTQLIETVEAVFLSWNNDRAMTYRKLNDISNNLGTAVNVQTMVYGNLGENSGTGVAFTRNPATGENKLFGEYLINAQGEDVVAGIRTPESIETLKEVMPKCYEEFENICKILENHYKDMQDMEFTIENGKLYMLQTRNAKRTGTSAIKVALDMIDEGLITKEEAILRVEPNLLEQLLHPTFDQDELNNQTSVAKGLPASPGCATGKLYFNVKDLKEAKDKGEKDLILVRIETSPEDIDGMQIANGILTIRGGMTSHAAVVARGMGTCCVSGCSDVIVDEDNKVIKINDKEVHEGEYISLDGNTGNVYIGKINTKEPEISGDFKKFMDLADSYRKLRVRANADNPKDAKTARKFGSEGIGLCRTEHMFFNPERIFEFRKMIVADTKKQRQNALNNILPYQRSDFESLFESQQGDPVIIRYLDPPLHEFLPKKEEEIKELATSLNISYEALKTRIEDLKEFNPMMGHRGCRLAITYPDIAIMQTKAVIEAAINVIKKGINVKPEIMIPLIVDEKELKYIKDIITDTADKIIKENNIELEYLVGTMIEVPRATLIADKLAKHAQFFSFGTNDLTQLTYGFSRDDASKFLKDYYDKNIFQNDPFAKIDREGVGKLIYMAIRKAKEVRSNIELGICGEHGGEKSSINFCHLLGLDYVSCSPYRVPIARLAAAQAAIKAGSNK